MRWPVKKYVTPPPQRWFAWYPVSVTVDGGTVWMEWIWRQELMIVGKKYYMFGLTQETTSIKSMAKSALSQLVGEQDVKIISCADEQHRFH